MNPPRPTRYRFHTCDVFTETRFGGNPLAVLPDAAGLSDAQMLVTGRRIVTLVEDTAPAGRFEATWDGRDGSGRSVAAGVTAQGLARAAGVGPPPAARSGDLPGAAVAAGAGGPPRFTSPDPR